MLGLSISKDNLSHNNNRIHSLHKHSSKERISITIDSIRVSDNSHRYTTSPIKLDPRNTKESVKYMSYPLIFKNKNSNIQKILKNRQGSGHFEKIIGKKKENKQTIVLPPHPNREDYYTFQHLFNTSKHTSKAVRRSLQGKISCKRLQMSSKQESANVLKRKMWSRRKLLQRYTEPNESNQLLFRTSQCLKDTAINLSPWGQLNDHEQN